MFASETLDEHIKAWFEINVNEDELLYGFKRSDAFSTVADNTIKHLPDGDGTRLIVACRQWLDDHPGVDSVGISIYRDDWYIWNGTPTACLADTIEMKNEIGDEGRASCR